MDRYFIFLFILWIFNASTACTQQRPERMVVSEQLYKFNEDHPNPRMRFKLIESFYRSDHSITKSFKDEISSFDITRYEALKPLVLEQDIPALQELIRLGKLTYRELTLFYIYRINFFENNPDLSLNAIISLNPDAIKDAEEKDRKVKEGKQPQGIFGMPVLLKDNIGFEGVPTTAGSAALEENMTADAFITKRLKDNGAVILGKANLSEWAYYFCSGCPLGYSAIGGQSMNPYGRMKLETGGSSSGSGTAIAANYAVAAVGTETSGSILSPSSLNSLVGFKPTVGLLSRTGIVPISATLDTPGPMTRSVSDNAILMDALTGYDTLDAASVKESGNASYYKALREARWEELRLVGLENLSTNTAYSDAIQKFVGNGAHVKIVKSQNIPLQGFLTLLNMDMKIDLQHYLNLHSAKGISFRSVQDIVAFNGEDMAKRAPYGQALFEGIIADTTSLDSLEKIKIELKSQGSTFFDSLMKEGDGDIVLSVNNFHAAYAAVARYPAITVPMGYKDDGEPHGITLIARSGEERKLYKAAFLIESMLKARQIPWNYK
jgi:amidase